MVSPPETGTTWRKLQEVRKARKLDFRTGAWPRRAAPSANWPGDWLPWCGGADEASSISYMEQASLMALSHRVAVKRDGIFASGAQSDVARHVPQELVRIEIAAETVDIGLVLAQRRDARADGGGHIHEVSRCAHRGHVGVPDAGTRRSGLGEDPPVRRVPAGIQHREPDGAMVGVVDRALIAPGEIEAGRDDDLGFQLA